MTAKKAGAGKVDDGAAQPSFEAAMQRLEAIVGDMEAGKLNLEDMIARFEEGQGLIAFCTRKLNEVEKRVEKLVKQGERVTAVPFDVEEEGGEPPAAKGGKDEDELF